MFSPAQVVITHETELSGIIIVTDVLLYTEACLMKGEIIFGSIILTVNPYIKIIQMYVLCKRMFYNFGVILFSFISTYYW
jgi:hypothetical protein